MSGSWSRSRSISARDHFVSVQCPNQGPRDTGRRGCAHFVCGLQLQLLEDFLRLRLGGTHYDAETKRLGRKQGASGVEQEKPKIRIRNGERGRTGDVM